jgi:enoyl-CoA hydratase/carnithine racemase
MSDERITYELDGQIALVGLDRPTKRNALNDQMIKLLREAIFKAGEEARCGVLFSHNENFSAGLDLQEALSWMDPNAKKRNRRGRWHRPFDLIARGPIPWVAAINGACIGGGLELASAVHVRVADDTAFFALPEGQRGIFVGGGGSVRISRLTGYARMADMMLTGRVLTADEGERYNLCQYRTPAGQALERAKSLARRIAENATQSNWAVTNALPRIMDLNHEDGLFMEQLTGGAMREISTEGFDRVKQFVEGKAKRLAEPGKSGDQ